MKKLCHYLNYAVGIFVILLILFAVVWFATYKFRDCKKVGHSTFYCIMDLS